MEQPIVPLQLRSQGEAVVKLQKQLYGLGYDIGIDGIDGIFGQATRQAVVRFQQEEGLTADGVAGVQTLTRLNEKVPVTEVEPVSFELLQLPPRSLLAKRDKTSVYIQQTEHPWELPFDGMVILANSAGVLGGRFATEFRGGMDAFVRSLDSQYNLSEITRAALKPSYQLSPSQALLIPLGANQEKSQSILVATIEQDEKVSLETIAQAVQAVLSLAADQIGLSRLVIPLMGTGGFNLSATGVITTVLQTIANSRAELENLTEVTLVSPRSEIVETTIKLAKALFNAQFLAQSPLNDLPHNQDFLNIKIEVEALAEVLMMRDLEPPLAVGILGGWGGGKSHILHLMQQRINEIRSQELTPAQAWSDHASPYVGHIYQIKFDAWTYAKADLWSSLMQTIFFEFNRQLTLEKQIEATLKTSGKTVLQGGYFWKALNSMSEDDRKALLHLELSETAYQALEKIETDQQFADLLWRELAKIRQRETKTLQRKTTELEYKKLQLRQATRRAVLPYVLRKNWLIVAAFLLGLALALAPELQKLLANWIPLIQAPVAQIAGIASVLFATINLWNKAHEQQEKILTGLKNLREKMQQGQNWWAESIKAMLQENYGEVGKIAGEIKTLEQQIEQYQQQVGLSISYASLGEFISDRLQADQYNKRLGVLQQVQRDLADLTTHFTFPKNIDNKTLFQEKLEQLKQLFPRGPARIVLYIDDLDRCPPDRVVEVLEAVQLLLKTSLFIVVLALDERYVARALEKVYSGVLSRQGRPSGTDYIEKIIQIPYRVRPIARTALQQYLDSLIQYEDVANETIVAKSILSTAISNGKSNNTEMISQFINQANGSVDTELYQTVTTDPADSRSEMLPPQVIKFTRKEGELLYACCQQVDLSPRTLKRLINVYKLFKIIWFRQDKPENESVKRAIISLLALSCRYPDLMRMVFEEIEVIYEEAEPHTEALNCMLIEFFPDKPELKPNTYLSREWNRLRHDVKTMELGALTLKEFGEATFNLVRSFCFVGDIGYDPNDD